MRGQRSYRVVWILLIVILILGTVTAFVMRRPAEVAGERVVDSIELTGQIRLFVDECVLECRHIINHRLDNLTQEGITQSQAELTYLQNSLQRLTEKATTAERTWIPVDEATQLLQDADKLIALVSQLLTTSIDSRANPNPAGVLRTNLTERKQIALTAVNELESMAQPLQESVSRAVQTTMISTETLLGFKLKYVLLIQLTVGCLMGAVSIHRAEQRLQVPPRKMLETSIRITSQMNPQRAIEECHHYSRRLLELADEIISLEELKNPQTIA